MRTINVVQLRKLYCPIGAFGGQYPIKQSIGYVPQERLVYLSLASGVALERFSNSNLFSTYPNVPSEHKYLNKTTLSVRLCDIKELYRYTLKRCSGFLCDTFKRQQNPFQLFQKKLSSLHLQKKIKKFWRYDPGCSCLRRLAG